MTTLTQCQQQVLDMLISYQKERGFPPTNQEVATMLGYGRCFADRQNLMVCLRSMPNVFTGSCARMRCCLSENLLYRHRNGHIQAEWP